MYIVLSVFSVTVYSQNTIFQSYLGQLYSSPIHSNMIMGFICNSVKFICHRLCSIFSTTYWFIFYIYINYGSFVFNFIRKFQAVSKMSSHFTIPPAIHESIIALHHYLNLVLHLLLLLFLATPIFVWLYLLVVLIYTSLMISDVGHLLICLFTIYISPLLKCLLRSIAHILN